jgi:hypothetical protein
LKNDPDRKELLVSELICSFFFIRFSTSRNLR